MKLGNGVKAVAIAGALALVPSGIGVAAVHAGKKTTKKSITLKIQGEEGATTDLTAKITGTFGKGTQSGKVVLPKLFYVWKFKGGTIRATGAATVAGDKVSGPWKATKGTGKFKGIKAKGTFSGSLAKSTYTFKGKASY